MLKQLINIFINIDVDVQDYDYCSDNDILIVVSFVGIVENEMM